MAGAPRGEGVIIKGMCRGGLGAASFQQFPRQPGATASSSSPDPLERWVCSSLDTKVPPPPPNVVLPRLGQEKPFLDHVGPSPLPAQPAEQLMLVAEGQSIAVALGGGRVGECKM